MGCDIAARDSRSGYAATSFARYCANSGIMYFVPIPNSLFSARSWAIAASSSDNAFAAIKS